METFNKYLNNLMNTKSQLKNDLENMWDLGLKDEEVSKMEELHDLLCDLLDELK